MALSATKTPAAKTARSITKTIGNAKARQSRKSVPKPAKLEDAPIARSSSKQSKVLKMLRASTGATIAAIMKVTGWKPHSVRGFLAGIVRKKLKLPLMSELVGEKRVYRIAQKSSTKP